MAHDDLFDLPAGSAAAARIDRINGSALLAEFDQIDRTAPRATTSEKRSRIRPRRRSAPIPTDADAETDTDARPPLQAHEPHEQQRQLAAHPGKREPGGASGGEPDLELPAEAGAMPRLSGFDIRNKEFGAAYFGRGYRRADVDEYLMAVAATLDEITAEDAERDGRLAVDPAQVIQDALAENDHMGNSYLVLQQARRVAQDTVDDARAKADGIVASAEASAKDLHLKVRAARDAALDEARHDATEILAAARREAGQILAEARERDENVSRREAEVELRAAHAEKLLHGRAEALRAEARKLEELVDEGAPHSDVLPLRQAE